MAVFVFQESWLPIADPTIRVPKTVTNPTASDGWRRLKETEARCPTVTYGCRACFLLGAENPVEPRPADWALALHGWAAVLHGDPLTVLHFPLRFALHAIRFHGSLLFEYH